MPGVSVPTFAANLWPNKYLTVLAVPARLWANPRLPAASVSRRAEPHGFAEAHESLDALLRVPDQIVGRPPCSRFAEHDDGGAAKTEH